MRLSDLFSNNDWLGIWPSISVVLFFVIFIAIIYQVVRYDKKLIKKWETMPLDASEQESKEIDTVNS
jgi:cbb3-type cytochrome oxidase subunit 3